MPRLSVGIPFQNAMRTLPDSIKSVFAQTEEDWELILIDDGSTDGGVDYARSLVDPRIVVVSDGVNRGLPTRLNEIARMARGRFLARLDADDIAAPERFAKQLVLLEGEPEINVVGTGCYLIDDKNTVIGVRRPPAAHEAIFVNAVSRMKIPIVHPTVMARTEWFRAYPYDEGALRSQDFELWLRTRRISRFENLSEPLCFYREAYSYTFKRLAFAKLNSIRYLRRHAGAEVRRIDLIRSIVRQLAMLAAFGLATPLHLQGLLLERRKKEGLSEGERGEAMALLARIMETRLPQGG